MTQIVPHGAEFKRVVVDPGEGEYVGGFAERFETHEFFVFAIRFALALVLSAFLALDLITIEGAKESRYMIGVALLLVVGVVQAVMILGGMRRSVGMTHIAFPFDILALVLVAASIYPFDNALFPLFVAAAVGESFGSSKRVALVFGLVAAFGYVMGHVAAHSDSSTAILTVHALNCMSIVLLPVGVAAVFDRYKQHAVELEEADKHRGELAERLQSRLAELQAVSRISEVIHSDLDFERVGPLMLDVLQKVLSVPSACVMVIDKTKAETLFSSSVGLRGRASRPAELSPGVLSNGGLTTADEHLACLTVMDHHNLQVVFCSEPSSIDAFTHEDRLVLQAVASELVVAVENSQLYKLTKRLAITDELTGLFNYRHLQTRLDEEFERARRYHKDLSMLMIDADDFKLFNDTHGHVAGDRALAELGEVLRASVREVDIVARYGGEEFSIVLPETDSAGAFVVAEKLREAISKHQFPDADGQHSVRITVSVGIATYPSHAGDRESLLRAADNALYDAKNGGKNRVRAPESRRPQFDPQDSTEESR